MNNDSIPISTKGTAILFDRARTYGMSIPEDGANIGLAKSKDNKPGVVQLIRHKAAAEPTFVPPMIKVGGTYTINVVNYIYCEYISEGEVICTVSSAV